MCLCMCMCVHVGVCVFEVPTNDCRTASRRGSNNRIHYPTNQQGTRHAYAFVPVANGAISKTPMGPFHTRVFERAMASANLHIRLELSRANTVHQEQ